MKDLLGDQTNLQIELREGSKKELNGKPGNVAGTARPGNGLETLHFARTEI